MLIRNASIPITLFSAGAMHDNYADAATPRRS